MSGGDGDGLVNEEKRLVIELMPEVLPLLKDGIKESSIDKSADGDEISAASARAPVGSAIVAAYQFRWFVTQVCVLGLFCSLIVRIFFYCFNFFFIVHFHPFVGRLIIRIWESCVIS
jgi:hypothetical protein